MDAERLLPRSELLRSAPGRAPDRAGWTCVLPTLSAVRRNDQIHLHALARVTGEYRRSAAPSSSGMREHGDERPRWVSAPLGPI